MRQFKRSNAGLIIIMLTLLSSVTYGQLSSVTITSSVHIVNRLSTHLFQFTTTKSIPADGQIVFTYETGFNLSGVNNIVSTTMDGSFTYLVSGTTLTITRVGGTATAGGSVQNIQFDNVRTPTEAGNKRYDIQTNTGGGSPLDAGWCEEFMYAGPAHHFKFTNVPVTTTAGTAFINNLKVTAQDEFDNRATTFTGPITWTSSDPHPGTVPADDGTGWSSGEKTFIGSGFILYTKGNRTLTVQSGTIVTATSNISVTSGPVSNFDISGGTSRIAGTAFNLNISNTVDFYGNTCDGTIDIDVFSGGGNSPNGSPPTIPSQIAITNGSGTSTNVILTNAVTTQFRGTAGSVVRLTSPISVSYAGLTDFSISASSPVTAGQNFSLNVSNAVDTYANPWAGTINVDASAGGGTAPNGTPPSFNTITVNNGTGSAMQRLTKTETTTLRGQSGGVIRQTSPLLVYPGALSAFTLAGTPATIVAGINFSAGITVTAYDLYGNVKTNYTGSPYFASSDPQAQLTYHSGSPYTFSLGNAGVATFPGSAFQLRSVGSQTITIIDAAPNPDVSKTSSTILVQPADISSFNISCAVIQTAGAAFSITINNAQDAYGNAWSGSASVSAIQGGGSSPNGQTPTFNLIPIYNGVSQANKQILVKAETGVELQVQAGSVTRSQANITVTPGELKKLKIRNAGGGQGSEIITHLMTVGQALTMFAAGYDVYDNYRTDEFCNWSSSGSLVPQMNQSGFSSVTFTPSEPGIGSISAVSVDFPSISDYTSTITVNSGVLDHFAFDNIFTQIKDVQFLIKVTAQDASYNRVESFTGTVQISDLSSTVSPQQLGPFVNGQWIGNVTVGKVMNDNRLTVAAPTGETGLSNFFNVVVGPGSQIVKFQTLKADTSTFLTSITTNQQRDWFVKVGIKNLGSVILRLDSIRLELKVNGLIQNDYTLIYPTQFLGSSTNLLQGGSTDSLLIKVDNTGQTSGPLTIEGMVFLKNTESGNPLPPDDASTSLSVQTPAVLSFQPLRITKRQITRGQSVYWYTTMVVQNTGESEVLVNSDHSQTGISFSIGNGWQIDWPQSMAGGDWILGGKEIDSLSYSIVQTEDDALGTCQIRTFLKAVELNTNRNISLNLPAAQNVLIEEAPVFRILSVQNDAENTPKVNIGQSYSLSIVVENGGQDAILNANLDILSSLIINGSIFQSNLDIGTLPGGQQKKFTIDATAGLIPAATEIISISGTGIEENTYLPLTSEDPLDDTTRVVIQNPARFDIVSVLPTETSLLGGRVDEWRVKVVVRNPKTDPTRGQADFQLSKPSPTDIKFYIGNQLQEDYTVVAPSHLKGGGLILAGGVTDTLIYRITATGRQGGNVNIQAALAGTDKNKSSRILQVSGSGAITVIPEQKLRIISTQADAVHMVSDVAYVNTNQLFSIFVNVENGLGQSVQNVRIHLTQNGQSTIAESDSAYRWIPIINPSEKATVEFIVTSSSQAKLSGERFVATIQSAVYQVSGLSAPPGPALDSTAIVIIQQPAHLSLHPGTPLTTVSTNQNFNVTLTVQNDGDAGFDDSGIVQIFPPSSYLIVTPADTIHLKSASSVSWQIRSPSTALSSQPFTFGWYRKPRDNNTNYEAIVESETERLYITTVNSYIQTNLSVSAPPGAKDDTLSTDQLFTVQAVVSWRNTRDIITELKLPQGYTSQGNTKQSVNYDSPTFQDTLSWNVKAPSIASYLDEIQVTSTGFDAIQNQVKVYGMPAQPVIVTTVPKAALGLSFEIISPEGAKNGSLSLGQQFTVEATVTNQGEADTVGVTLVTIDPLPRGYSTPEALTKSLVDGKATWNLTAPLTSNVAALSIVAMIYQLPLDENTNLDAEMLPNQGSFSIPVITESYLLAVDQEPLGPEVAASVVPGQKNVKMIILNFDNRGIAGGNKVDIKAIKFDVEDRFDEAISPSAVLAKVTIVNEENAQEIFGISQNIPSQNPVTVTFSWTKSIPVDGTPKISILVDIADPVSASYFQLNLKDETYISAFDHDSGYPVSVKDIAEQEWSNLRSVPKYIYNPETESNLWSSPNPLSESATVYYYLSESSDVNFKLFTLVGDPVWSLSVPEMSAGPHTITWDGTNGRGKKVLNGVYWLFMQTNKGIEGKFKIAVVR